MKRKSLFASFSLLTSLSLALSLALGAPLAAHAHGHGHTHQSSSSELSSLSALPLVISAAVPVALVTAGAVWTVTSVSTVAEGAVWVLERASDGVQASVTVSTQALGGLSVVAGTALVVTACSAGWVLSTAGRAVAFVPNELGRSMFHNQRLSR
jgi:hypothetical protein